MTTRRTLLGAAWAMPVIATAVTVPAVSASTTEPVSRDRIVFTNITATVGEKPNRVYANTRVMLTDGPAPVTNVTLTISTSDGQSQTWTWPEVQGWQSTEQVYIEFDVTGDTEVFFRATADGETPITGQVLVTAPDWWE